MGIAEACSRLVGGFAQAINGVPSNTKSSEMPQCHKSVTNNNNNNSNSNSNSNNNIIIGELGQSNNSMQARALMTVFGMQNDGMIHKDKARQVVEKLGLIHVEEEGYNNGIYPDPMVSSFDLSGVQHDEVVAVEEALGGSKYFGYDGDGPERALLLRRAFEIFDENGNGFIEAVELKRVFECLGLDCNWGMDEFERMLIAVDLNFDGKVDFGEFELMMMGTNCNKKTMISY